LESVAKELLARETIDGKTFLQLIGRLSETESKREELEEVYGN
jgi:Ca2+-binding EF-hand superfamily protein